MKRYFRTHRGSPTSKLVQYKPSDKATENWTYQRQLTRGGPSEWHLFPMSMERQASLSTAPVLSVCQARKFCRGRGIPFPED